MTKFLSHDQFREFLYSSCFEIPEAAVNLQRRALGKHNNVKRLFKGEACRLIGYGI
ncbi:MAG: hypothetical protein LBJ00_03960 [Planctomycetaceae bacterium]|jgi:hypothetical protein|nr:hypothetical protein [Planctomycetaceae bacterium]